MLNIAPMILLGSLATWVFHPLIVIALTFDGIVYSLVSYSYNLFLIMSKLNFDIIYGWFTPIIDRIKAVILVFIMFKVGISLVQYMLEPEKFNDKNVGGAALIKNIGIVAILLILYPFVFSALNELSALIIGIPDYNYSTLSTIADITGGEETGLITRFIFGAEADVENFGKELSIGTLEIFLHSAGEGNSKIESIYGKMQSTDKNFDMMEIVTVATEVGRSIDYKWPLISTAAGLYIVYSLVTISIEIGIRMLKLVIMQILAPVIIVSMVGKGFAEPNWNRFCKQYISIYLSAFFRIATMYITIGFISKFFNDASVLFKISESQNDGVTPFIIKILMMVAAFKFSKELPKFIDGILGTHIAETSGKFGGFLKSTLGGAIGGVIGLGTGLAAGTAAGAGFGGILASGARGMFNGGNIGSKGKGIADYFKAPNAIMDANKKSTEAMLKRQDEIRKQGGFIGYMDNRAANALGIPQRQQKRAQHFEDSNKAIENLMQAKQNAFKDIEYAINGENIKYGSNVDEFINNGHNTNQYKSLQDAYQAALGSGNVADVTNTRTAMENFDKSMRKEYEKTVSKATLQSMESMNIDTKNVRRAASQVQHHGGISKANSTEEVANASFETLSDQINTNKGNASKQLSKRGSYVNSRANIYNNNNK